MRHLLKRATLLVASVALSLGISMQAQTTEEPIITIYSNAYAELGETNQFSILLGAKEKQYYDIDLGAGLNEIEVDVAGVNTETGEFTGTIIPCRVNESGLVKIYGDAQNIDVLVIDGAYATKIEMEKCTELQVISMRHNLLQELDLTPFTKAYAIYLTDNPFSEEFPLIVGAPKNELAILELDIIDHLHQSFNLSDYPALLTFDGYRNLDLHKIDPTGCPNLMVLNVELTQVETIDVSKNPNLIRLNVSDSRVRNIDISHNSRLQHFLADHFSGTINTDVKLESIDVSQNPDLTILSLSGNNFKTIDLSNNAYITNLRLSSNQLTSLDLSKNTQLYSVDVKHNNLDYATLPLPQATWGEYFYEQNDMPVAKSHAVGATIDLSHRVLREGTNTSVFVMRKHYDKEASVLEDTYYTYEDGKITFNNAVPDSVYVVYYNDAFADYAIQTSPFVVKDAADFGKPSQIVQMATSTYSGDVSFGVGLNGATAETPKTFYVDFGDGTLQPFTTTYSKNADTHNVVATLPQNFKGYISVYVDEGDIMTSFDADNLPLSNIQLSAATELRQLSLSNCDLYSIELQYNRCLEKIDLSNNHLYTLDLTGIYGNYEKNVLTELNVANNELTTMKIVASRILKKLDMSHNAFESFSLTNFDKIDYIDMSYNKLSGQLALGYLIEASHIDLSHNKLTEIQHDGFTDLQYFDISNNNFTLATVPDPSDFGPGYTYAPQAKIQLQENAPAINLSTQNRIIDGIGTTFAWYKTDGTALIEGVDFECNNGATRFLNIDLGKVYCEMSNPAFPQFAGENIFSTTEVNIVGAPTNIVATFTTLNDATDGEIIITGNKKTALYIDWRGDGSEFICYPVETSYIVYPGQTTYAGANVKVYTYDSADDITVFTVNKIPMAEIDLSALKNLIAVSILDAGLTADKISLPDSDILNELNLSGNIFEKFPYEGRYPNLEYLSLSDCHLKSFDASKEPKLAYLILSGNEITETTFDNPAMWNVSLNNNLLESIDLTGMPNLIQLFISGNKLSSIDITPVKKYLKVLDLAGNYFTFATLPIPDEYNLNVYYYNNQANINAECVNGVVDLSSVAEAGGNPTQYTWFIGEAVYDIDLGGYVGETLFEDDEYTIENGVTTFNYTFDESLMCLMTNAAFPSLIMKTNMIDVTSLGIDDISVDSEDTPVNVYNLQGVLLKSNVNRNEALEGLNPGLYIVGGKKYLVK